MNCTFDFVSGVCFLTIYNYHIYDFSLEERHIINKWHPCKGYEVPSDKTTKPVKDRTQSQPLGISAGVATWFGHSKGESCIKSDVYKHCISIY